MKKYLMTGIAALAMCAGFTSCSHDLSLPTQQDINELVAQKVTDNYNRAFIDKFGQPAENQDWGFGSVSNARAITRAIQPSFNFPSDADASKFLADVPAGVEKLSQNVGRANNWIDETWTGELNIWGAGTAENGWVAEGGTLYVKGNCDFSNRKFYFAGNSELYLVKGATLTLGVNDGSGNLQTNTKIYIAEGAKLIAKGELKLNNGLQIFNHGTIEAPTLSTNNNSVLYNVGTVKVTNKISVENTLSVVVNDGTITATDLNTAGSGKFENNNSVTISGTTLVNSNDNTWVNNGQYRTGNFIYNAASDEVINNCRLTVDEDFNMNLGDNPGNGNFKMDAGAGVVTKYFNGGGNWAKNYSTGWSSFNGGPFYIYMGAGSVFKVTETATMNATKANYGIYGPESGNYAVFTAKNIVAGAANQGYEVTYGGNLYVYASNGHFANGWSGQYPYIDFKGNAKIYASGFESGKPAVKIKETSCNPGFEGDNTPDPDFDIRILGEDLTPGDTDWDFNDVVFGVKFNSAGNGATCTLIAAGGTLPLYIATSGNAKPYGEEGYNASDWVEVHDLFGVDTKVMVNTGGISTTVNKTPTFDVTNINSANTGKDIRIFVEKTSEGNRVWVELLANQGEPAAKLAVTKNFKVCTERQNINTVYTRFSDWVGNTDIQWY